MADRSIRAAGMMPEEVEMKSDLFRRWRNKNVVGEIRLGAGEMAVHAVAGGDRFTVAVEGRVTVDSSPHLRSVLLRLLRRGAASAVVIDLSAVSYMDMSGIATLLEALKAAREGSAALRLAGVGGQVRALAEIGHLDNVFRSSGSEVEFR